MASHNDEIAGSPKKSMGIDFEKIRGFPREKQLRVLQGSVDRIASGSETVSRVTCLIQGPPGSGKGFLCDQLEEYCREKGVVCCRGVFEEGKGDTIPFPAVAGSLGRLYKKLTSSGKDARIWKDRFEVGLGMHTAILATIIPVLLEQDSEYASTLSIQQQQLDRLVDPSNFKLLVSAIRAFISLVCKYQPLVWILKDLQSSSKWGFRLVQMLLNDRRLPRLCFVATHTFNLPARKDSEKYVPSIGSFCCRSDDGMALNCATILEFRNSISPEALVEVRLENLSETSIADMLGVLTQSDQGSLLPLAKELHRITGGNYFFVRRALSVLENQEVLSYNFATSSWQYDIESFKGSLNFTDIVAEKIRLITERERQPLIHASFLGTRSFDIDALFFTFDQKNKVDVEEKTSFISVEELKNTMQSLVGIGILEKLEDEKEYAFVHQGIQRSTYALVPKHDRSYLHLQIGRNMLRMVQGMTESDQWSRRGKRMRLEAIRQINKGSNVIHPRETVWLAKLNHQAARILLADAQFFPAVKYLSVGLELVHRNDKELWAAHYCTMLGLVTLMARAKFVVGMLADSSTLFDCILTNARTFHDKLPAYYMKALGLTKAGKLDQAYDLVLNVLSHLGVNFSPKDYLKFRNTILARTARYLARRSDEELMNISGRNIGPLFDAVDFVVYLRELASLKGESSYYHMAQVWMAQTTLKGGPSVLTRLSYVLWAMHFIISGDLKQGARLGNLAAKMGNLLDTADVHDVRATLFHACYCQHWTHPYQVCMDLLVKTNRLVMERGYSELMAFGILGYSSFYFCCGMNLEALEQDLRLGFETLHDLGYVSDRDRLAPILQLVRILQGGFRAGGNLSGDVMDQDTFLSQHDATNNKYKKALHSFYRARLVLLYSSGNFEEAFDVLKQLDDLKELRTSSVWVPFESFYHGMILYALARKSSSKAEKIRCVREADKMVTNFSGWVKEGAVNCYHTWLLLRAEQRSVAKRSSPDLVRKAYDEAIAAAARLGFLQDRALGNERAGLYFLDKGDESWAASYLSEARLSYSEWGAFGKVEQITKEFGNLLSTSSRHAGSVHRARPRMSKIIRESYSLAEESTRAWNSSTASFHFVPQLLDS